MTIKPIIGEVKAQPINDNFSFLASQISNFNGSPKGTYASLSALQTAYPNGAIGVYVVSADGKWYYWNGTAWAAGGIYQSVGIAEKSVTPSLLSFIPVTGTLGKNLFDKDVVTSGKFVEWHTGNLGNNALYCASDWISVQPSTTYTMHKREQIAFYDTTKIYVSGSLLSGATPYTFTTPTNCYYIRISTQLIHLSTQQLELGGVATEYESYQLALKTDSVKGKHIKDGEISQSKLNFELFEPNAKSINLFNKNAVITDKYVEFQTGNLLTSASWVASDYLPVDATTNYAFSNRGQMAWYDVNKVYISGNGFGGTTTDAPAGVVTSPSGAKFLRVSVLKTRLPTFQVEKGDIPTDYVPFGSNFISESQLELKVREKLNNIHNPYSDKTANFIGDSITWGFLSGTGERVEKPYPTVVKELLGLKGINNYGINGSTIAGDTSSSIGWNPIVERYVNMTNADFVIVAAGTNDFGSDKRVPLGTIIDTTNTTFYGALNNLCKGLVEKYLYSQIMFTTPLKRSGMTNAEGLKLEQFAKAIKEVCDKYSIPVLDLYTSSGFHVNVQAFIDIYAPDKLHGTQAWYNIHGRKVANFIKTL